MAEFEIGDKVRLKSGGPVMTAEKYAVPSYCKELEVFCQWFEGSKLHVEHFHPEMLAKMLK